MKKLAFSAVFALILTSVSGQDIIEKISKQLCNCIDTIENMDSLQNKLDRCMPEALSLVWNFDDAEEDNQFADNDSINKVVDSVMENLAFSCPKIRVFVLSDKEAKFYKMSGSDVANNYYNAGYKAFNEGDFKTAEKQYEKAIKADPDFIYAFDNLGLTYRKLGDYKKAIKYYSKSLEIYPEGSFALQNEAITFLYLKDTENALKNYTILVNLYPDNPEGFFGTARINFMKGNYEEALDYAFYSHKMYVSQKSDYAKDSEELISLIHNKMKDQNKLDIFFQKAKEYGIDVN